MKYRVLVSLCLCMAIASGCSSYGGLPNNRDTSLYYAISNKNLELVKECVDSTADINSIYFDALSPGKSPLLIEYPFGTTYEIIELLVHKGCDINSVDKNGYTPLMAAASGSSYAFKYCELYLDNGADVDIKSKSGETALDFAVAHENMEIAKLLIERGAVASAKEIKKVYSNTPINYPLLKLLIESFAINNEDETLLDIPAFLPFYILSQGVENACINDSDTKYAVAAYGNVETLRHILEGVGKLSSDEMDELLRAALICGNADTLRYLLRRDEAQTVVPSQLMEISIKWGERESVYALLENYDISCFVNNLQFLFEFAGKNGDMKLINILIEKNVVVDQELIYICLYGAAQKNDEQFSTKVLKRFGGHISDMKFPTLYVCEEGYIGLLKLYKSFGMSTSNLTTELVYAAAEGKKEIVEYLLYEGVNVNATTEAYGTAILIAAQKGYLSIVEHLIANGADLSLQYGLDKKSILEETVWGSSRIFETILDGGCEIDYQDNNGMSPLMYAISSGRIENANILLRYGASTELANSSGDTALDIAKRQNISYEGGSFGAGGQRNS